MTNKKLQEILAALPDDAEIDAAVDDFKWADSSFIGVETSKNDAGEVVQITITRVRY